MLLLGPSIGRFVITIVFHWDKLQISIRFLIAQDEGSRFTLGNFDREKGFRPSLVEGRVELTHALPLAVVGVRPLLPALLRRQDLGSRPALLRRRVRRISALLRVLANEVDTLS